MHIACDVACPRFYELMRSCVLAFWRQGVSELAALPFALPDKRTSKGARGRGAVASQLLVCPCEPGSFAAPGLPASMPWRAVF